MLSTARRQHLFRPIIYVKIDSYEKYNAAQNAYQQPNVAMLVRSETITDIRRKYINIFAYVPFRIRILAVSNSTILSQEIVACLTGNLKITPNSSIKDEKNLWVEVPYFYLTHISQAIYMDHQHSYVKT